jgi:heme o synthase
MFLIIFLWTPPHSWALALYRTTDYARAGVPMLPVVAGIEATKRQIFLYSLPLALFGIAPTFLGMASALYGLIATVLGITFVVLSWRVARMDKRDAFMAPARRLFAFSLLYLFLLYAVLLAEAMLRSAGSMVVS